MARLSELGKGRSYHTDDPANVPRIFTSETLTITRDLVVEGNIRPRQVYAGELIEGFGADAFPALGGYQRTYAKPAAQVLLLGRDEDPVLVSWRYGLGKAVAFTSDLSGRWGRRWVRVAGLRALRLADGALDHAPQRERVLRAAIPVARTARRDERGRARPRRALRQRPGAGGLPGGPVPAHAARAARTGRAGALPRRVSGAPCRALLHHARAGATAKCRWAPGPSGWRCRTPRSTWTWAWIRGCCATSPASPAGACSPLSGAGLSAVTAPSPQAPGSLAQVWWPFFLAALVLLVAEVAVRRVALPKPGALAGRDGAARGRTPRRRSRATTHCAPPSPGNGRGTWRRCATVSPLNADDPGRARAALSGGRPRPRALKGGHPG